MKKQGIYLFFGGLILLLIAIAYFIQIPVDSGSNFVTYDRLLGIIIFHSKIVLGIYFFVGVFLIFLGIGQKKVSGKKK